MKTLPLILFGLLSGNIIAREAPEKEIKSQVSEVTVFIDGAQVTRKKTVELEPGKSILKFTGLSPYIDAKSVQVNARGDVMILSVHHQLNFPVKTTDPEEIKRLQASIDEINDKLSLENTYLSIIADKLKFLQENTNFAAKNEKLNMSDLQQASDYYGNTLTALKLSEIERNKTVASLNRQKSMLQNQINALTGTNKESPTGEILVKIDTKKPGSASFELSYLVGNAGWFPSYDIRAKNINEPVQITYKANVRQDTKADWNNVKLRFSSSDPNASGIAPQLRPYYLNYNLLPPVYNRSTGSVNGRVVDNNRQPLPGVSVVVEGTSIGTITDMDGRYSITVPGNGTYLTFSFVGYTRQTLPVSGPVMDVVLNEDVRSLNEITVVGYGVQKKRSLTGAIQAMTPGISAKSDLKIRGTGSLPVPTTQTERQTTVDFEIETPYTIKSDNRNYTVDMTVYDLPATYQYFCVPKIDKDAFLIAEVADWEKYNFLEGEANLFFEGTYIGKTLLDARYTTDTLEISLGRDKKVTVSREKIKDYTTKQFIGNKKEEIRAWKTTIKNNKNQKINMLLLDQVPISMVEDIEVDVQNISGAELDAESGEAKWEFSLDPAENKELELKYAVKFPKNRNLIVE